MKERFNKYNKYFYLIIFSIFLIGCKPSIPDIGKGEKLLFYNFYNRKEGIQIIDLDGKHKKRLSIVPKKEILGCFQWSLDGKRLFFYGFYDSLEIGDSYCRYYKCNFEEKKLYILSEGGVNGVWEKGELFKDGDFYKWSPDESKIVYQSHKDTDIWIMDSNGKNKRNLTNTPTIDEMSPDFHPDGKKILFFLSDKDNPKSKGLYTINIDGKGLKKLIASAPPFRIFSFRPLYSPRGDLIAFLAKASDTTPGHIYIMDENGENPRILTKNYNFRRTGVMYCWSPDGKRIAFCGEQLDKDGKFKWGIYTINIDGSNLRLICPINDSLSDLAWRPYQKD